MVQNFILLAVLAGCGVALIAGLLGSFITWRRMAYFGDSLGHSSLLGIALGIALGVQEQIGMFVVCSAFAIILSWLPRRINISIDTQLGVLAHSMISLGIIVLSFVDTKNVNLHDYLFGNILLVDTADIITIYAACLIIAVVFYFLWDKLLLITLHHDIAKTEGINTVFVNAIFMVSMAITVAVSVQTVGLLLITSLLIIPSITSNQFTSTPLATIIFSVIFALVAVLFGIAISFYADVAPGPSIILVATLLLMISATYNAKKQH